MSFLGKLAGAITAGAAAIGKRATQNINSSSNRSSSSGTSTSSSNSSVGSSSPYGNTDFAALMNQAAAAGKYELAAQLEQQRNNKIKAEGLTQYQPTNYYSYYLKALDKQESPAESAYAQESSRTIDRIKEQEEAAAKARTEATLASIYGYKPKIEQNYNKAAQESYISKMQAQRQMSDQLAAMGYTGGAAESTMQGVQTNYQNARLTADQERNNALNQIEQLATQARISGDANLANIASSYYESYLNALNQAQEQSNWEKEFSYQQKQDEYNQFTNNIYANYNDLEAYAQRLIAQGYSEDSPEVRAVRAARQQKIITQQEQERALAQEQSNTVYERALELFRAKLITEAQFSQMTGIPVRALTNSNGGKSSRNNTGSSESNRNALDSDYATDLALAQTGRVDPTQIMTDKSAIINQYGQQGYNEIYKAALNAKTALLPSGFAEDPSVR